LDNAPAAQDHTGKFHGTAGDYFPIYLKNFVLTILTLGIYHAWATANNRKFFLSNTEFAGGRYDFHGTGQEIFKGRLKAFAVIIVLYIGVGMLSALMEGAGIAAQIIPTLLLYAVILYLIPLAVIGTMRYRLSRISWNNIRHQFSGNVKEFRKFFIIRVLLIIFTLGVYTPFFQAAILKYIASESRLGNHFFSFSGNGNALFTIYLKMLILGPLTLGIYLFWGYAEYYSYILSNISIKDSKLKFNCTGMEMLTLTIPNMLIILFTLGFGTPIAAKRTMDFLMEHGSLDASFDPKLIEQGDVKLADATGEGMGDALELDIGL